MLFACLFFGAAIEAFKSQPGAGFDVRSDVGNWSSLWLVMPLVMGYQFRRAWAGALAGLAATLAALVGFYAMNAVIFPQPEGLTATLSTFSQIMARWALFGLASGPLVGALGTRLSSVRLLALVSGLIMLLEPVLLSLWGQRQLPLPGPLGISWWFQWRLAATLEAVLGGVLVLLAIGHRRPPSHTG